uniref:Ig-like domain-containing protein n=1 Tax=Oreochromis aureus TaxID=47969 RepID=A0A668S355_OREAU
MLRTTTDLKSYIHYVSRPVWQACGVYKEDPKGGSSGAGQIQLVGPSQAVTVMVGDDIILPCHLKPASDASAMTFEWARPDLKPRFVHVWHEGQDLHVNQHSSFKGRTSVDITKLKHGDISLKLSKVKHSDRGIYRCYFPDLDKETTAQLVVGSVSQAVVKLAGIDQSISGVVLQCESAGWYPEPELLWLDGEGNLLSAGPTETLRGPDDLYTVSSRVTVEKRHSNNITCRVQQRNTNQSRETHTCSR